MKKERVKFEIKEMERTSYVPLKKFMLILVEIYCIYGVYQSVTAMRQGGSAAVGILCSVAALLWTYGLTVYMRRGYRCIPVSDKLNADVLAAGVEKEKFVQAGENVWKSDSWVVAGKQFFPKNTVTRLERRTFCGKNYTVIWTITGGKYRTTKGEALQESWFPFPQMLKENGMENVWNDKNQRQKITEFFREYINVHETADMLKNTGFLRQCVENAKKN